MKNITEHDVLLDGVRHHYAEGPNNGPAVVFVPGQSMPWQSYQKVIPLLSKRYHLFALDVRGHGKSEHTPGNYSFSRCGKDLALFLREVVKEPAICCGNSSGGIIALWAAANEPELVSALLMEDPPLFTTHWPRLRDDTWVYGFFLHVVKTLPDLATFFATLTIPTKGKLKLISFPRPLALMLGGAIRRRQKRAPGMPVDIWWLPLHVRLFVRGLSEYDVDFTRACTDGSMCDLDHAILLRAVHCPALLIKADAFRHPDYGIVGSMGEEDSIRAQEALPEMAIEQWHSPHMVHLAAPKRYVAALDTLARQR